MNVKAGDMAIVIKSGAGNEGKIVMVAGLAGDNPIDKFGRITCEGCGPCWLVTCESGIKTLSIRPGAIAVSREGFIPDSWLRPISGIPDTEEENKEKELEKCAK